MENRLFEPVIPNNSQASTFGALIHPSPPFVQYSSPNGIVDRSSVVIFIHGVYDPNSGLSAFASYFGLGSILSTCLVRNVPVYLAGSEAGREPTDIERRELAELESAVQALGLLETHCDMQTFRNVLLATDCPELVGHMGRYVNELRANHWQISHGIYIHSLDRFIHLDTVISRLFETHSWCVRFWLIPSHVNQGARGLACHFLEQAGMTNEEADPAETEPTEGIEEPSIEQTGRNTNVGTIHRVTGLNSGIINGVVHPDHRSGHWSDDE
jgi:hypothetical protein